MDEKKTILEWCEIWSEEKQIKKWDIRFLELAKHISTWSKDPSVGVGCVIVDDKRRIISMGYNGFPRGIHDNKDRYEDREIKLKLICHADRNALDNAPCSVEGMTMYITHPPCTECQKSIIQKGIRRVVWYLPSSEFKNKWGDGTELLKETYHRNDFKYQVYEQKI